MRRAWTLLFMAWMLSCCGCKTIFTFSVHKDWAVDSHPLNSGHYNPDLRTGFELSIEKEN